MKIRKPNKQEFETYVALETEFFSHHKPYGTLLQDVNPKKRNMKKEFNDLLKQKNAFFRFAEVNGEIGGYVYGMFNKIGENEKGWKRIGELNSIVVSKNFRRQGLAEYMTKEFFKWLKSKKVKYVEASCNVKNEGIIKFNKKLGFKEQHIKFGKII